MQLAGSIFDNAHHPFGLVSAGGVQVQNGRSFFAARNGAAFDAIRVANLRTEESRRHVLFLDMPDVLAVASVGQYGRAPKYRHHVADFPL
jgi:hypothetical protein